MGSSKKATVGHKYSMGQHCDLVHGPIDHISRISFDTDRVAWRGRNSGGTITVHAESLFGGDDGRGGVSGQIDLMMGRPDQQKNSYLMSQLGSLIPAFRGVVTAVFKQFYFGNSEFLAPVSFRGTRTMVRDDDGKPQWYLPKASIFSGNLDQPHAIYIALDTSISMDEVGGGSLFENMYSNGNTRLENAVAALNTALDFIKGALVEFPLDICVVAWADSATSITRRNADASDIDEIKAWISALVAGGGTNFTAGVGSLNTFFSPVADDAIKKAFFITDGIPNAPGQTPEENAESAGEIVAALGVPMYAINIDLDDTQYTEVVDNTPEDGVPVINGGSPEALIQVLIGTLDFQIDQNPAHILRETDNSQIFGLSLPDADIDDDAFIAAADRLYDEGMGISLLWDSESMTLEDFQGEITRHIDANHFIDNKTGLATIKLIRDDYDIETLPVLDASSVIRVERAASTPVSELVNAVTVVYWDPVTGKDASVQVSDPALVQMQGRIKSTTIQYPGFTNANIATRAAMRDLRSLSNSLFTCTLIVNRVPEELNNGSPFILVWPELKQFGTVMRIADIDWGDGRNNDIRITCTQDVFALPDTPVMATSPGAAWEDPRKPPLPSPARAAFELPYYDLVQSQGQAAVDATLSISPELGMLGVCGIRPSGNAINARIAVDAGGGYVEAELMDFCPSFVLTDDIDQMTTSITFEDPVDLDELTLGAWAVLGGELCTVTDIDINASTATLKRAVLDTAPVEHAAGTRVFFAQDYTAGDAVEYVDGEDVSVRIMPITSGGQLALSGAPTDSVSMASRAIRPYPPADVKINGEYFPTEVTGDAVVTWAWRNRLQQTGGTLLGFTDAGVTPEDGMTVSVEVFDADTDALIHSQAGVSLTELTVPAEDLVSNNRLELFTVRDDIESWQRVVCEFTSGSAPSERDLLNVGFATVRRNTQEDPFPETCLRDNFDFADGTGLSTFGSGITISGGIAVLPSESFNNRLVRSDRPLSTPFVSVCTRNSAYTGSTSATHSAGVGVMTSATEFVCAIYNRNNNFLSIMVSTTSGNIFSSGVNIGAISDVELGFSLIGGVARSWRRTPGSTAWVLVESFTVASYFDLDNGDEYQAWYPCLLSRIGDAGGGSVTFSSLKSMVCGPVRMRDMTMVTLPDGSVLHDGQDYYFTATIVHVGATYTGICTLNLDTYDCKLIGSLFSQRSGVSRRDLSACVIQDGSTWRVIMGWVGSIGADIGMTYAEIIDPDFLTSDTRMIDPPAINVPNVPVGGGGYDGTMVKIGATWHMAYTIVDDTSFGTSPYYAASATSTDLVTWTAVGYDDSRVQYEGTKIIKDGDDYYIAAGGPQGLGNSSVVYDLAMTYLGALDAVFKGGTQTQPHPMAFRVGDDWYILSSDNNAFGGSFTWGNPHILHGSVTWSPANLPVSPALWLDDESSITDASGYAAAWSDRSDNTWDFAQTTSSSRPAIMPADVSFTRFLQFDGVNDYLVNATTGARDIMRNTGAAWCLSVYKERSAGTANEVLFYVPNNAGPTRFQVAVYVSAVSAPAFAAKRLDGDATATLPMSARVVDDWIMRLDVMDWSVGDGAVYVNGELDVSNLTLTSSGTTSNTASSSVGLGICANGSPAENFADVDLACLIVGVGTLPSGEDIDKLFGWAAWHFGLQDSLPVGHPYKDSAPV